MDRLILLLLVCGSTQLALANELYAGLGVQEVTLLEHYPHTTERLVKETGWIPSAIYGTDWAPGKLRIGARIQQSFGTIPYDGQTQNGIPHETETTHFINQVQLTLGYAPIPRTELYTGLNLQHMARNVANRNNIYGATETYTEVLLRLGFKQTVFSMPKHQVQLWAELQPSLYARSDIDSRVSDDFSLTLSKSRAGAFGMHYRQQWSESMSWFVDSSWLYHRYQNSTVANNFYQPPISFRHVSIYSGLSWHFN